MELTFNSPINEGQIDRKGITIQNLVIYPEEKIVINNVDNTSKTILIKGLSDRAKVSYDVFMDFLTTDVKDEYETGAVTAKANDIQ